MALLDVLVSKIILGSSRPDFDPFHVLSVLLLAHRSFLCIYARLVRAFEVWGRTHTPVPRRWFYPVDSVCLYRPGA